MSFNQCLREVLKHEGGYSNHPFDPGGPTNMGITQKTYENWVGYSVTDYDIACLTFNDIKPIYKDRYWNECSCDSLPSGIDLMVFDFGVNSGPPRASRYLQQMFPELTVDGIIGPVTLATVREEYNQSPYQLIDDYCDQRLAFLQRLSNFTHFGRGWTRRVESVRTVSKGMV